MNQAPVSNRNGYLDLAKGILIILVVWGHLIQCFQSTAGAYYNDPVFKAIYMFHMPLFMAISGYLSYHSISKYSFGSIVWRRFSQLIGPALFWGIIINTGVVCVFLSQGASLHESLRHLPMMILKSVESFWFLWAVFLFTAIMAVLRFFQRDAVIWMIVVAIAYLLLPKFGKDYLFRFTMPFFFIGYKVAQLELPRILKTYAVTICSAVLTVICYLLWDRVDYVYVSQMQISWSGIQNILFRFMCGIVVSILFLNLIKGLYNYSAVAPLKWIGQRSLEIYILHGFILKYAEGYLHPNQSSLIYSSLTAPLIALIVCALCAGVSCMRIELQSRDYFWGRLTKEG